MADEVLEDANLENMDLNNFKPEDIKQARQQLLDMLKNDSISEEMKENLRAMLGADLPVFGGGGSMTGILLGVVFVLIIFSIIFFFGYKLYKSIKEKEKKREEKKKAKQMKKKK